jgi:hypothetical protein
MASSTLELHEPLADGHIRLLELNLEHEHDIAGQLRPIELTSAPSYYALSYVCGNEPYEHGLTINNTLFKVKPNLYAALRRLQSYFRSARTLRVLIWIDAICINQDNADEKAKQIQGMHEIFSKAENVLILLGSVPQKVHMVLSIFSWIQLCTGLDPLIRSKFLERLEQIQEHDHREDWVGHSELQLAGDIERLEYVTQQLKTRHKVDAQSLLAIKTLLERLEQFGLWVRPDGKVRKPAQAKEKLELAIDFPGLGGQLFHPDHPFWAGVYELSEIEWNQRVWTYQEVVLARNAQVFAESLSVDWSYVVVPTIGLLWAMEHDTFFGKIDEKAHIVGLPTIYDRVMWFLKWQQAGGSGGDMETTNLFSALIATRNRKSALAKDKVYGLLAVIRSSSRALVPIEYTATDGKVFASAVKADLKYANPERIISVWEFFDEDVSAMEDLPSWCPNLASKSSPTEHRWHDLIPQAVLQQTSALACYEHSPGFQTIRVKVLKIGVTTAGCVDVACPFDYIGSQFSPPSDIGVRRTLEEVLEHWLLQLRAVFSDHDSAPGLSREVIKFLYGTTGCEPLLSCETFWETLDDMLLFDDFDLQPLRIYDRPQDWAEFRKALTVISNNSGRYLFNTTSGRVGFGSRRQTPGNLVVLLPGSTRMHMLSGDCTQYCGIVSLPGMSEDALLELVNAREKMWEMVELR